MNEEKPPDDYYSPDWQSGGRVHEWKNYISEELQAMWVTFTDAQRAAIARSAQINASAEDWD